MSDVMLKAYESPERFQVNQQAVPVFLTIYVKAQTSGKNLVSRMLWIRKILTSKKSMTELVF